nr:hypothetical protein [Tanacetum cinerariifolium]
ALLKGRLLKVTTAKHRLMLPSEQMDLGKDFSNLLMADNLPKIVCNEALAIPDQTTAAAEEVCQAQDDVSIPTKPSTSKPYKKHKSKKQQPKASMVPSPKPSLEHQLPSPSNDPILDADKDILSMHDIDEEEPAEVEEVLEVVKATKLFIEVVTSDEPTTTAAQVPKASAPRKRRGVIIQDPDETAASVIMHTEETAKKQRIDKDAEELKRHPQIVANDDDDV